jgi:hypothetical protein
LQRFVVLGPGHRYSSLSLYVGGNYTPTEKKRGLIYVFFWWPRCFGLGFEQRAQACAVCGSQDGQRFDAVYDVDDLVSAVESGLHRFAGAAVLLVMAEDGDETTLEPCKVRVGSGRRRGRIRRDGFRGPTH